MTFRHNVIKPILKRLVRNNDWNPVQVIAIERWNTSACIEILKPHVLERVINQQSCVTEELLHIERGVVRPCSGKDHHRGSARYVVSVLICPGQQSRVRPIAAASIQSVSFGWPEATGENPNGIPQQSPGLRGTSYPG